MNKKEYLLKKIKQAIYDFDMIENNETVVIAVSLWKDSMFLSYMLNEVRKTLKNKFNIIGVYLDNDLIIKNAWVNFDKKRLFFENNLNIPLKKIEIKLPSNSKLNDWIWKNCQRCSYARRVTLMKLCKEFKAKKIAFWHHMDDIVTTSFMNMISWRNLKIMPPINKMSSWDITFIRPLAYLKEKDIEKFVIDNNIPYTKAKCEVWENKMRNLIKKDVIWENEKIVKNFTENIFWSFLKEFKEKHKKNNYFI